MRRHWVRFCRSVCAGLLMALVAAGLAWGGSVQDRAEDPAVVSASILPELAGTPVERIFVFRYDSASGGFVPIPFQVDERVDHVIDAGSTPNVHEVMYDVFGEDDGLLDSLDEIALMYADAGDQAPSGAAWPARVDPGRFEIRIADPRPGGPYPDRFAYVFTGIGLTRSATHYVSWSELPASTVSSAKFSVEYQDNWILTGYRVASPCGTGDNLLDRVKGRAGLSPQQAESENTWNATSQFLGGIEGPVRSIRYVRGAASGIDTVHHDVIYRGLWDRVVNLRVHPINGVWLYFDMLPRSGTTFLASTVRAGVPVDGVNDAVPATLPAWTILRGTGGGLATVWDVPPSPFYGSARIYYRDDASYNDAPALEPDYADRDNSAIGDHGVYLDGLTSSTTDTIPASFRLYPLCASVGDATLGDTYRQVYDAPLQMTATRQSEAASAVRNLSLSRSGIDAVLSWAPVDGALGYRVYSSTDPAQSRESWTLLGTPVSLGFVDAGACGDTVPRFYSVTAVSLAGEGPW